MLIICFALMAALVAVDQIIKYIVVSNIEISSYTKYFTFGIGDFDIISIMHIRNDGAAWSFLSGQTWLLIAITAVVMAAIVVYMFVSHKKMPKLEILSLSLIVAGGIGNLIDRVRMLIEPDFAGVIDYINFEFISFPVFNFADICVVIGGCLFLLNYLISEINEYKAKKHSKEVQNGAN